MGPMGWIANTKQRIDVRGIGHIRLLNCCRGFADSILPWCGAKLCLRPSSASARWILKNNLYVLEVKIKYSSHSSCAGQIPLVIARKLSIISFADSYYAGGMVDL